MLLSCADSTSPKSQKPTKENSDSTVLETAPERMEEPEDEESGVKIYPRLNNETVVDFLQEYAEEHPQTRVLMETNFGDIELRLYKETPIHRANFLYLIEREYYNPTEILRIVKNFVIQGGNSEEPEIAEKRWLIGEYTLPPEFTDDAIHLRGALAMSRSYVNNPDKRSSGYDFYIVHGKKIGPTEIYEAKQKRDYTDSQIEAYQTTGGAIHLDQEHTVFGEVVRGISVVNKIASLETDKSGWPKQRVEVRMKILD